MSWRIYEHVSKKRKLYWTVEDSSSLACHGGPMGNKSLFFKKEDAERALSDIKAAMKEGTA